MIKLAAKIVLLMSDARVTGYIRNTVNHPAFLIKDG